MRDGLGADAVQYLGGELLGQYAVRRGRKHQRGGVGGGEPVAQPVLAHGGDPGHIDHDLGEDGEADRQEKDAGGQAEAAPAKRRAAVGGFLFDANCPLDLLRIPRRSFGRRRRFDV